MTGIAIFNKGESIMEIVRQLNGIFWGWLVAGILLCNGLFFTLRLHFPQIRYFTRLFGNLLCSMRSDSKEPGGVSGFSALCAAVGGQVGTGSLVGVATALASGGPGAIFWMWMTAILGMPISFAEAVLAQLFRVKNPDGTYRGGPAYYMEMGLHCNPLAILYSFSILVGIGFFYCMIQSNSISVALTGVAPVSPLFAGILLLILVALVIFGGIKRLSEVASYIVPFMALGYLLMAGYTVKQAFRYGVARGLFSNDAGNGTAPSMHATAVVPHPVNQGFAAMLGTFITTIIICSCTAFCILLSNQLGSGETGIALTQLAFESNLGSIGRWIVFLAMFLFGFTTLLADIYYGEVNLMILVKHPKAVTVYRLLCCAIIIAGAIAPVPVVWDLVDFASAFMVFFNVIALVGLSRYVVYALKDYARQWNYRKNYNDRPVWDFTHQIGPDDLKEQN